MERPLVGGVQQRDNAMTDCSLDESMKENTVLETLCSSELVGGPEPSDEDLLCFSDHSDIVSLDGLKEGRNAEDDHEDIYFGAACSSQYAFAFSKTAEASAVAHTSSSEDQEESPASGLRRRRTRRNTVSTIGPEEETQEDDSLTPPAVDVDGVSSARLLPLLLVVASMTVYCFLAPLLADNSQLQGRPERTGGLKLDELQEIWELLQTHMTFQDLQQLDDQKVFSLLVKVLRKVHKENQDFRALQDKSERLDEAVVNRESQERTNLLLEQQRLSLSALQEELRSLHLKIQHVPMRGRLRSENQRLKLKLVRQNQIRRSLDVQAEELRAEILTLRSKLATEERVSGVLKEKVVGLKAKKMEKESELQELRSRRAALEEKLNHSQQRADMWERLYVEATAREKGDSQSKWERSESVVEKLEKTYEKAREALKVKLREFRKFKESFFRRASDFYDGYRNKETDRRSPSFRPVRAEEFDRLLQNYLRQVGLSHNWAELKMFSNKFFKDGLFLHHQMPFRDFISRLKSQLARMTGLDSRQFEDVDFFINLL